ncbi:MAG: DUF167 domain-containing protein [Chloroflexota bacterium]
MAVSKPVKITVHVQPSANQNKITDFQNGVLRVRIAAPPVKGKANQELVKYLSSLLGVSKSNLSISKGATGKNKTISITGLERQQVFRLLEKF